MRTSIVALVALLTAVCHADEPAVVEHELFLDGAPAPFYKPIGLSQEGYRAGSWEAGPLGCKLRVTSMRYFNPNGWSEPGLLVSLPPGSELLSSRYQVDATLSFFTVPSGTTSGIAFYYGSNLGKLLPVTGGRLRQVSQTPDFFGNAALCWLVDSPHDDFFEIHRYLDYTFVGRRIAVEKSKALHNFFIDKVRTAYVSTIAYDGTVHHRQVATSGQVRWHRFFPADTQLRVDEDGNTFALRSTVGGITIARYNYDGNQVGATTLPLSIGRRIDAVIFERQHYLMLVTSRPTSNGRSAYLVRINPELTFRVQPIEGNLNPDMPTRIASDLAQTYVCSTTTGTAPEEIVQAFDTQFFVSRWAVRRVLGENEDRSELLPNQFGLLTTNNRNGRGVSRTYLDHGFFGFWKRSFIFRGGQRVALPYGWYQGSPEFRTMSFVSSDPVRCKVPSSEYSFSGFRSEIVYADLAPVTVRTHYRVDAHDSMTVLHDQFFWSLIPNYPKIGLVEAESR
ncbi:MAG: hypothetical protein ABL949_15880 [Fimbriimonadaceae bacterium]